MKKFIPIALLLCAIAGCEKIDDPAEDNTPNLRVLSQDEKVVIASTNEFAFKLWNQVNSSDPGENNFISPLSVAYALAMTYNGASGSTKSAIGEVLSFDSLGEEAINASFKTLTEFLFSLDKTVTLNLANSIWYRNDWDLHVKKSFSDIVTGYYDAGIEGLDFTDLSSKDIINNWIENETNGMIKDMLDQIPPEAVMYLVNAIYFKSSWTYRFDKTLTQKDDFFLENGETVQVDMMRCKGVKIKYNADGAITLVDMPYGNGQYSFTVIMPSGNKKVDELAGTLTAGLYGTLMQDADTMTCELVLPKFTFEYKINLNEPLAGLGMGIAFTDGADFSGLFEEELSLAISRVLHQAKIDVNEEGTEAAAATIAEVGVTSANPEPLRMVIDRPFLFIIHEKHSNTILFCGKMMNPIL